MKRTPHEHIVSALYNSRNQLHKALDAVASTDVSTEDVSVITNKEDYEEEGYSQVGWLKMHDESLHAAKLGGLVGFIVAGMAMLVSLAIEQAPLVPSASVIFMISALGGLLGAIIGGGFKEDEARVIDEGLDEGKVLLSIHAGNHRTARKVESILRATGGLRVHHL